MTELQLTIIVPIYNAENYLHQCLHALLKQSFSDFELLLIDDGSSDFSGRICDEYAAKDKRIRVFHQTNQGASSARNVGLENARGEWIYFPDADDIVAKDGIERLFVGVYNKCMMSIGGYEKYDNKGNLLYGVTDVDTGMEDKYAILHRMFTTSPYSCQAYLWNKLFNAEIIRTHNLRFDPSLKFSEDRLFVIQYICALPDNAKIYYYWKPVYRYIQQDTGAMASTQQTFNPNFATDLLSYVKIRRLLKKQRIEKPILKEQALSMLESYRCYLDMIRKHHIMNPYYQLQADAYLVKGIGLMEYIRYYVSWFNRKATNLLRKVLK